MTSPSQHLRRRLRAFVVSVTDAERPKPKPAPAPEPNREPAQPPTIDLLGLLQRWGIDSLEAVQRIVDSDGFPREWGEVQTHEWMGGSHVTRNYKVADTDWVTWLGPDGHWLLSEIEDWEQHFAADKRAKEDAALLKRELAKLAKKKED